jgi:hypothetical protein
VVLQKCCGVVTVVLQCWHLFELVDLLCGLAQQGFGHLVERREPGRAGAVTAEQRQNVPTPLQRCYKSVTAFLKWCCRGVREVSQ